MPYSNLMVGSNGLTTRRSVKAWAMNGCTSDTPSPWATRVQIMMVDWVSIWSTRRTP